MPPGEPIIVTEEGKPLRGLIGPFNEGDPLTLACRADIGKPRPTLKWLQEGSVIDDSFSFDHVEERNNIVRNSLEIPKLTRAHLLAVLSCQAANNNITAPSQTSVTLDINRKYSILLTYPFLLAFLNSLTSFPFRTAVIEKDIRSRGQNADLLCSSRDISSATNGLAYSRL